MNFFFIEAKLRERGRGGGEQFSKVLPHNRKQRLLQAFYPRHLKELSMHPFVA